MHLDYQSFILILQLSIPERLLVRLELTSLCLVLSNQNVLPSLPWARVPGLVNSSPAMQGKRSQVCVGGQCVVDTGLDPVAKKV